MVWLETSAVEPTGVRIRVVVVVVVVVDIHRVVLIMSGVELVRPVSRDRDIQALALVIAGRAVNRLRRWVSSRTVISCHLGGPWIRVMGIRVMVMMIMVHMDRIVLVVPAGDMVLMDTTDGNINSLASIVTSRAVDGLRPGYGSENRQWDTSVQALHLVDMLNCYLRMIKRTTSGCA